MAKQFEMSILKFSAASYCMLQQIGRPANINNGIDTLSVAIYHIITVHKREGVLQSPNFGPSNRTLAADTCGF